MRQTTVALLVCSIALGGRAASPLEERWEGVIRIPGNDQPVVLGRSG
jgi:hypothetical protein